MTKYILKMTKFCLKMTKSNKKYLCKKFFDQTFYMSPKNLKKVNIQKNVYTRRAREANIQ